MTPPPSDRIDDHARNRGGAEPDGPGDGADHAPDDAWAGARPVPRVIVALAVGAVLLTGYVVHALRAEHPLIGLKLFGGRGFSSSVVTMFLLGGMLFALLFLLPLFYQQVRGHGVFVAGLLVMPLGLGLCRRYCSPRSSW
jgi:hypothetical protein